jgi:hypothetical protein
MTQLLRTMARLPRFERIASLVAIVLNVVVVGWLFLVGVIGFDGRPPESRLRRFFTAQAEAILSGRLSVSFADGAHECFVSDGLCYGYFGLTPSLLRIPFLGMAGGNGMTDIFVFAGLVLGIVGSIVLVNVIYRGIASGLDTAPDPKLARLAYLGALTVAGPGSLYVALTLPTGYEEAIIFGAMFATWGIVALVLWLRNGETRWLGWASLAFVLGANTRPSAIPISIAAAFVVIVFVLVGWRNLRNRLAVGWAVAMGVLPIASSVGVWYAKFGVLLPPLEINEWVMRGERWKNIMEINGGRDSWWGFIPTNLVQYLRPDSLFWSDGYLRAIRPKFEKVLILPPLEGQGIFVSPMASVTALVPAVVLLVAVALWKTPRMVSVMSDGKPMPRLVSVGLAGVGWSAMALLAINVGLQNRYMGDLIPAITITAALGAAAMGSDPTISPRLRKVVVYGLVVLACVGIVISVAHQLWQISRYT